MVSGALLYFVLFGFCGSRFLGFGWLVCSFCVDVVTCVYCCVLIWCTADFLVGVDFGYLMLCLIPCGLVILIYLLLR